MDRNFHIELASNPEHFEIMAADAALISNTFAKVQHPTDFK
jgi:hypothetical protein